MSGNESKEDHDALITVGSRFQCDSLEPPGPKGVVRFMGAVESAKNAVMVGVEWDLPGRGKNDGSVDGVRYFTCAPGFGSFLHPKRILSGITFTQAFAEKYGQHYQGPSEDNYLIAKNPRRKAFKVAVEFVGEAQSYNKLQTRSKVTSVSLDRMGVSSAGDPAHVLQLCPNVQFLDLSHNLFSSWGEVVNLIKHLPLRELILSHNHLVSQHPEEDGASNGSSRAQSTSEAGLRRLKTITKTWPPASGTEKQAEGSPERDLQPERTLTHPPLIDTSALTICFASLRVLVLNDVPNAWPVCLSLLFSRGLLALEELHVCKNGLSTLLPYQLKQQSTDGRPDLRFIDLRDCAPNVRLVSLAENQISDWNEIFFALGLMPRLTQLTVNNNNLSTLSFHPTEVEHVIPFAALTHISLDDNKVSELGSIWHLSRFPVLTNLRIQRNSVATAESDAEKEATEKRLRLIGALPALRSLNSSPIPPRERADGDHELLILLAQRRLNPTAPSLPGLELFDGMYERLVRTYGDPLPSLSSAKAPGQGKLSSNLLAVTITWGDKSNDQKLPRNMKLAQLKLICKRVFGKDPSACTFRFSDGHRSWILDTTGNNTKTLQDLDIADGTLTLS